MGADGSWITEFPYTVASAYREAVLPHDAAAGGTFKQRTSSVARGQRGLRRRRRSAEPMTEDGRP